jgi:hypothetical protein
MPNQTIIFVFYDGTVEALAPRKPIANKDHLLENVIEEFEDMQWARDFFLLWSGELWGFEKSRDIPTYLNMKQGNHDLKKYHLLFVYVPHHSDSNLLRKYDFNKIIISIYQTVENMAEEEKTSAANRLILLAHRWLKQSMLKPEYIEYQKPNPKPEQLSIRYNLAREVLVAHSAVFTRIKRTKITARITG